MTIYKELLMKSDAFRELRTRIDALLTRDDVEAPVDVAFDERTGDMLVTGVYAGVRRTHRLIFKEEPEGSSDRPQVTVNHVGELLKSPAESPVLYVRMGPDNEGGDPEVDVWAAAYVAPNQVVATWNGTINALGVRPSVEEIQEYLPQLQTAVDAIVDRMGDWLPGSTD